MKKCVFCDRDGVINQGSSGYIYNLDKFHMIAGVSESLKALKAAEYLLIILTNQAGISKEIYSKEDIHKCHRYLQKSCNQAIDGLFYAPYHPDYSASLSRKPNTLMFERAIAKYQVDVAQSWMVGDRETDILPARKMGIKTILIGKENRETAADRQVLDLKEAVEKIILNNDMY